MAKVRSYSFKIRIPERSWSISLRRLPGKPRVRACRNPHGKLLHFKDYTIGDRLIVLISGPAQKGTLEVDFSGNQFGYFQYKGAMSRFKSWLLGVFGVSSGKVARKDD